MVDQLNAFASEVTPRGARGRHRRQARRPGAVPGVAGTWKDLTDNVNSDGLEPHRPGPQHRRSDHRGGQRRSFEEDHGRRARRNPRAEGNDQHDGRSAHAPSPPKSAAWRARSAPTETGRPGAGARRRRDLEGSHRQRQLHGLQPHRPGPQHRRRGHRDRARRPEPQDHRRCEGRNPPAQGHHQHDGRSALGVCLGSHARGARSGHRGQARRSGRRARRGRHLEGPHRQRQFHGLQPDRPGAQHRRSDHRGGQRRSFEEDHRRRARGDPAAQGNHQHDGRAVALLRLGSHARGARGRHRGTPGRAGRGARRRRAPGRISPTRSTRWAPT